MKKKSNLSRNIAIFGVFAVLAVLAGGTSWLSTAPRHVKVVGTVAAPELPREFDVVPTETQAVEVEYLTAAADEGATVAYPQAPKALSTAAKAWIEDRLEGIDGDEIRVDFEPVLAAGPYLGVQLTRNVSRGQESTSTQQNFFSKIDSDHTWKAQELITEEAHETIARFIRQAAKAGVLHVNAHPRKQDALDWVAEGLPALEFTATGAVLPVPGTQQSLLIKDPTNLLTSDGERIAAAAAKEKKFTGLPAPQPAVAQIGETITFPEADGLDCQVDKCIALTFDDGPVPGTNRLLDILADQKVRSTFFLIGSQIPSKPEIVQRMVADGHVVGNHTWNHLLLPQQSRKAVRAQIDRTTNAIVEAGAPQPTLFRPPYGAMSDMVRSEVAALGYATILWDVDTLDWATRDTKKTVESAVKGARPGGIILMHDIHNETIDAVPEIITRLRQEGFTLVTVPELFAGQMTFGGVYRNSN